MKAVEETMINEDTGVVQQLMLNNYHIVHCFALSSCISAHGKGNQLNVFLSYTAR